MNDKLGQIKKLVIEKIERDRLKKENEKKELENRKQEWKRVQDKCKNVLKELPEEYKFKISIGSWFIYVTKNKITKVETNREKQEFTHYGDGYLPLAGYGTHPLEQKAYELFANNIDSVLDQIMEQLKK